MQNDERILHHVIRFRAKAHRKKNQYVRMKKSIFATHLSTHIQKHSTNTKIFKTSKMLKKHVQKYVQTYDHTNFQKIVQENWSRVIRKYFNWRFWYLNFILETWNWKLMKNTWSIEAKMLDENLEIQAHFKVRFLRRNDKLNWIKYFQA